MFPTKSLLTALTVCTALATGSANAATIFDVSSTGANGGALDGDTAGTTTTLTLSPADGGGTIDLTNIKVDQGTPTQLKIANGTMGTSNEKWGNTSLWEFSLDQEVSFDGFTFATNLNNTPFKLTSSAWVTTPAVPNADDQTGPGWSFDGETGSFSFNAHADTLGGNDDGVIDFTSATVAHVAADTKISLSVTGVNGGGMTSFTITPYPVPEPTTLALIGLGGLMIVKRRR